jgi:hypothetical protein
MPQRSEPLSSARGSSRPTITPSAGRGHSFSEKTLVRQTERSRHLFAEGLMTVTHTAGKAAAPRAHVPDDCCHPLLTGLQPRYCSCSFLNGTRSAAAAQRQLACPDRLSSDAIGRCNSRAETLSSPASHHNALSRDPRTPSDTNRSATAESFPAHGATRGGGGRYLLRRLPCCAGGSCKCSVDLPTSVATESGDVFANHRFDPPLQVSMARRVSQAFASRLPLVEGGGNARTGMDGRGAEEATSTAPKTHD